MSEEGPLEDIVRWFQHSGLVSTMMMPPKVVKLGASQVRQMPRLTAQDVEDVIKVFAAEKQKDEPITEDKKAEQKNDEKKSPTRKKVKMRKTWQQEKEDDLSHHLREKQEIAEEKKQKYEDHRKHENLERFVEEKSERGKQTNKQNFKMQTKACSQNGIHGLYTFRMEGSRLTEMFENAGRYRFIFSS